MPQPRISNNSDSEENIEESITVSIKPDERTSEKPVPKATVAEIHLRINELIENMLVLEQD